MLVPIWPVGGGRVGAGTTLHDTRAKGPIELPTRVVIAEDEAIIRLDLKETLEEEGYDVVGETGRGDEAVDLVKEHEPDIAILDIKMPGLDGLSAAREIAGERRAAVLKGLDSLGIEYLPPKATFFIWARVPNGQPSLEFCKSLIDEQGLVITPGMGFGPEGEGYFRLAMTVDVPRIEKAMGKLEAYLKK